MKEGDEGGGGLECETVGERCGWVIYIYVLSHFFFGGRLAVGRDGGDGMLIG